MKTRRYTRRALSDVISSILLSAAVLVVGGTLWNYANGASGVIASQYFDDSMELMSQLEERFMVEHVTNSEDSITIYIYNYGDVDISVDIYANSYSTNLQAPLLIESKTSENATISMPCSSGDNISIKIYSRRQNIVYYQYIAK